MEKKESKKQETTQDEVVKKNLAIYEQARIVPESAIKPIVNGRLKGKSDINPVYRIKRMTEIFGPCGFGWRYTIVKQWLENYLQEVKAFTVINLYIKMDGEWSEPIPGVGGASFVSVEKSGQYVNDECFKMSLTDALSVAMKALGIAADIYYAKDGNNLNPGDSKYREEGSAQASQSSAAAELPTAIAEMRACNSRQEYLACWDKWVKRHPEFSVKNHEFYNVACEIGKKFPK
jgi:hypothetical protein